ncbi:cell wall-binding repeat-containing protein [Catenulispora rubra]|uniref:cell wall-binding repeat-containing protein n=1 Tax=Catenulispora rubra TaxID=280293 RepID=UPI0018926D95|nr:cell wall-binding repeat-containing protein [Catenulispora rubra]
MPLRSRASLLLAAVSAASVCTFSGGSASAAASGDLSGYLTYAGASHPGDNFFKQLASVHADGSGLKYWTPPHAAKPGFSEPVFDDPSYSPDGSRLAYLADYDLWVAQADGSSGHLVRLTATDGGLMGDLSWSPDGSYIYFTETLRTSTLYRIRPNGSGEEALLTFPVVNTGYSVAPNGNIAYADEGAIAQWNPSSGAVTRILAGENFAQPEFSPDGTRLLIMGVLQGPGQSGNPRQIYVVNVDGTGLRQLTTPEPIGHLQDFYNAPTWSPDGRYIAFSNGNGGDHGAIGLDEVATGTITYIAGTPTGDVSTIAWQSHAVPASGPVPAPAVDRIGGADRIETAIDASRFEFDAASATGSGSGLRKASCVVLSRMDTYADALSGSALAGQKSCPLLLTPTGSLDPRVLAEMHRVLAPGGTVYLLGGTSALSPSVAAAVRANDFLPTRLAGTDRYLTSLAVASAITKHPRNVFVATGEQFPDALGAGAAASSLGQSVVVLSAGSSLESPVRDYIAASYAGSAKVLTVGGSAAQAVGTQLPALQNVDDISGADRYATAAALFARFAADHHPALGVATGHDWPDALAGGAVAGANNGLLLLTDGASVPAVETAKLAPTIFGGVREIMAFGGSSVVQDSTLGAISRATDTTGWTWFVDRRTPALP